MIIAHPGTQKMYLHVWHTKKIPGQGSDKQSKSMCVMGNFSNSQLAIAYEYHTLSLVHSFIMTGGYLSVNIAQWYIKVK